MKTYLKNKKDRILLKKNINACILTDNTKKKRKQQKCKYITIYII